MIYILIMVLIIVLDQATKFWALSTLKNIDTIPIIKNVLHLTYAENTGAAFSIFRDSRVFLLSITTILLILLIYLFNKYIHMKNNALATLCVSFMLAGGIANMIDRVRLQYVVDFIDFRLINFAIFNIADSFIVIGIILFAINTLFFEK